MNGKALTILNTSCLSELSRITADSEVQTFLEGKENQYTKRKTESYVCHTLVLPFLSAKNENRQLEDLPQADFGRLPERLLLSVRTKSVNENFVN